MRKQLAHFNLEQPRHIRIRIAINTGRALTGDIGSPKRREFTVLGDVVNTAAELKASVAQPDQIVISERRGSGWARPFSCARSVSCHSAAGSRTWRHSK